MKYVVCDNMFYLHLGPYHGHQGVKQNGKYRKLNKFILNRPWSAELKLSFVLLMASGRLLIDALILTAEAGFLIQRSTLQGLLFIRDWKYRKLKMTLMI